MKSITIHNLDDSLDALIRQQAKKEGLSLNKTIQKLLAKSLGLGSADPKKHRKDFLDQFGVWTARENEDFQKATADFEKIDPKDWA